jgi:tetratricopeptide (TPR) repeat protein/predicted Ser/Thr protein kinase
MTVRAHALLEPGALFSGALFKDLLRSGVEPLSPGARLGAFRVVRELGRGGMGIVYLGERDDGEFEQRVALKCLYGIDSETRIELFRRERQILAGLQHPNIARLVDGGRSDDGKLWFAMEWIDGERIDIYCARHQLWLEARLQLWMQVAEVVQFAHAHLVIHRDIKPSNVVVDSEGRPKLLDFGIAGLIGEGDRARAYSPGYASPEQRAGTDVGIASDQYQLGLLLRRMLGAELNDGECVASTAQQSAITSGAAEMHPLMFAESLRISSIRRQELCAILDKACAADPKQRYASVSAFHSDVQRALDCAPVEARLPSASYTALCVWRRHPRTVSVAIIAMMLAIAATAVFNLELAQERNLARAEAAKAQAINAFVSDDLLRSDDLYEGNQPEMTVLQALDRARDRIADRFAIQPDVEASLRETMGMSYSGISAYDAAIDQLQRALDLRTRFESSSSEASRRLRLELSHNFVFASRYAEAETELQSLIDEIRLMPDAAEDLLHAQITLAEMLGYVGQSERSLALFEETAAAAATLDPSTYLAWYREQAYAHQLVIMGQAEEALPHFEAILSAA